MSALMRVLGERWVLTLALADPAAAGASPYAAPLFYALAQPDTIGRHAAPLLIFASDATSHHGQLAGRGPTAAAAAVYLETDTPGQVRGAQLRGSLVREDLWTPTGAAGLRQLYVDRHPIAAPMLAAGRHHLYALVVSWAKLTDNRLGFGVHPIARFDVTCAEVEQSRP
ncbi:hypothetical protein DB30_03702 [Enhygromyxa salina]|uniref:Pyridoxamine 5'-phosphate oxidase putative domain-containing protein n=1 Tax=Enhygromyxa salina TaxID=215803 RepID=A0A0C2D611_9BACT|nr:hypothetical protein DB30_03702 [Enhygromyxa salina]